MARARRRIDESVALILALLASWIWLAYGAQSAAQYAILLIWLVVGWWLSILWHELGHVLAARLSGLDPYVVLLGSGRSIARLEVGGTTFDFGWFPGGGLTVFAPKSADRLRARAIATLAAGPAATTLLLGAALPFVLRWEAIPAAFTSSLSSTQAGLALLPDPRDAALTLAITNALVLATTMLPLSRWAETNPRSPDCAALLRLLASGEVPWAGQGFGAQRQFARSLALREYDLAAREARNLLRREPGRWQLRLELGTMLLWSRRYREALCELDLLIATDAPEPSAARAAAGRDALAGFARACLMVGTVPRLRAAVRASTAVLRGAPLQVSAVLTQSAALALLRHPTCAERRLEALHGESLRVEVEAEVLAIQGLIASGRGQIARARAAFAKARYLDPECALLGAPKGLGVQGRASAAAADALRMSASHGSSSSRPPPASAPGK